MNLIRIQATVAIDNLPSIKMLEKFLTLEPKSNRNFLRSRVNARGSLSGYYSEIGNNKRAEELMIESVNLIDPTDSRFRDVYALTMNDYYLFVIQSGQIQNAITGFKELMKYIDENIIDIANFKPDILGNI
jgi:tetratricopeptide (TPR) repeat protein